MRETIKSVAVGLMLGMLVAGVFAAGYYARDAVQFVNRSAEEGFISYGLLNEVQVILEQSYLRALPPAQVREYAAIRGLLSSLEDRNTFLIDPPVAASEQHVLLGTYGGIGVSIRRDEQGAIILTPFADGPAARAGIVEGDRLIAVNGVAVQLTDGLDSIDQSMRGEVGNNNGVAVTVASISGEEKTFFIPFEVIVIPSIIWRVLEEDARIGYVHLLRFTERTPSELDEALADLIGQGVKAVVIDVRNNGGGLLLQSVDVAGAFISEGVIAHEINRNGEIRYETRSGGLGESLAVVVLINERTASAAEIVAGAIQDYERGTVIGQRTFGKGTMQRIYQLSDGSSIHVTFAEWLTPNRRSIDRQGIIPDIEMIPDINGRDVELGEAIRVLRQVLQEGAQ
ncbi:MAG: S41 family peptidase [Anaerolineae bacterium]